jgi:RNA polymerase sigma-70 factor (ECF subfamily)
VAGASASAGAAEGVPDLETLYRLHAPTVGRWAGRLAGPSLDVEDLVHDVFVLVDRLLPRYRPTGVPITAWLYQITANVVRHQRRKQRWRRWLGGSAEEVADTTMAARLSEQNLTPGELLEKRQATLLCYRILDTLPEKYRTILILFELEGLSGEEIAQLTDTKLPTVWTWLRRARQQFAERAEQERKKSR